MSAQAEIFISYRHDDEGWAGRVIDTLLHTIGRERLFVDRVDLRPGQDFTAQIEDHLAVAGVFVPIVGPHWIREAQPDGRLHEGDDMLRMELRLALDFELTIMPVTVAGVDMPPARLLPADLAPIMKVHSTKLNASSFIRDVAEFAAAVDVAAARTRDPSVAVGANKVVKRRIDGARSQIWAVLVDPGHCAQWLEGRSVDSLRPPGRVLMSSTVRVRESLLPFSPRLDWQVMEFEPPCSFGLVRQVDTGMIGRRFHLSRVGPMTTDVTLVARFIGKDLIQRAAAPVRERAMRLDAYRSLARLSRAVHHTRT